MEKDKSEKDRYDRLLRYVYADNVFVNLEMIKSGYAKVACYNPDIKYCNLFKGILNQSSGDIIPIIKK